MTKPSIVIVTDLVYFDVRASVKTRAHRASERVTYRNEHTGQPISPSVAYKMLSGYRWFEGMDSEQIEYDIIQEAEAELNAFDCAPTQEWTIPVEVEHA